ncbi:MAG TPA: DEAD/DEAH box helicase [Nitrospira sp.]|nr:DEAD/DEAH box helicase [Nitrospira sp.]
MAKLDSTLSARDERETVSDIREGEPELIYLTPERLEQDACLQMLRNTGVSLVVVDEAHCVSQWGHDFRPAYLAIRRAVREVGRPPVLALTATATPSVADDIVRQLDVPEALVVNLGSHRENLVYEVRTVNDDKVRHLTEAGRPPRPILFSRRQVSAPRRLRGRLSDLDPTGRRRIPPHGEGTRVRHRRVEQETPRDRRAARIERHHRAGPSHHDGAALRG